MPNTHDTQPILVTRGPLILSVESCFWHLQRYPKARLVGRRRPLTELAAPREVEDPYRKGHGRAFRLPGTRWALVVGYWEPPTGEPILEHEQDEHLLTALDGLHLPGVTATEIREWTPPSWAPAVTRMQRLIARLRGARAGEEAVDVEVVEDGWQERGTGEWKVIAWDDDAPIVDMTGDFRS